MAPFPWLPMIAISGALVTHGFCLSSLYPYLGYMVRQLGATDDKDAVGFYAGYLGSAFMLGRFFSSYFWGRFSDKRGRLPAFYIGLWSMVITSIAFGVSFNFSWALTCRLLMGLLNCVFATGKTLISEVCGPEHEVVGMGFISGTWSISYVVGPALGGLLAEPARHYPRYFSETGIFARFPYLLPNIVAAGTGLVSLLLVYLFLHETRHANGPDNGDVIAESGKSWRDRFVAPVRMLSEKRIRGIMIVYGVFSFIQIGFSELFPLWALSTLASGGLDWTTEEIGRVLSMVGVMMMVFQVFFYPFILRRVPIQSIQRWSSLMAIPLYIAVPQLTQLQGRQSSLVVATTILIFLINSLDSSIFINMSITTNNVVKAGRRGEVNGLEMMVGSLAKALGPFCFSVLFAWSISRDRSFFLDRHLAFLVLTCGIVVVTIVGWDIIRRDADEQGAANRNGKAAPGVAHRDANENSKLMPTASV